MSLLDRITALLQAKFDTYARAYNVGAHVIYTPVSAYAWGRFIRECGADDTDPAIGHRAFAREGFLVAVSDDWALVGWKRETLAAESGDGRFDLRAGYITKWYPLQFLAIGEQVVSLTEAA